MTVIAFDGKLLVADGRMTTVDNSLISENCKKLHDVRIPKIGHAVVGLSGRVLGVGPYLDHLAEHGLTKCEDSNVDSGGILVTRKGECIEFDSAVYKWTHTQPINH